MKKLLLKVRPGSAGAAFATAILCLSAGNAQALFAQGCNCGAISAFHSQTRAHTTRATTDAARDIVSALQKQSQQNSQYLDRQVEARKRIADGEAQNAALRLRDMFRAEAEGRRFDPNPDFCLLMDMSDARPSGASAAATGRAISNSVAVWNYGMRPAVKEGGVRLSAWLARERDELRNAGGSADATTDWSWVVRNPTAPILDADAARAAARLISNTVNPVPPKPLTENDLSTPAGLSEAVWRRSTQARNQAAAAAVEAAMQLRIPKLPSEPYRTMASRAGYSRTIPETVSELQALEIRVASYYSPDTDVLVERHSKSERALLQDLIDLQSINARMRYLNLELATRLAVANAAMLGIMTDGIASNLRPH